MRVRVIRSVKVDGSWISPGTIREFENTEAQRLIRLRAVEMLEITSSVPVNEIAEDDSNDETYTDEELAIIAKDLCKIDGVTNDIAYRLIEYGYTDAMLVMEANATDLLKIKGIGNKNVNKIQESAEDVYDSDREIESDDEIE